MGLYGVLSYLMAQRTGEVGVRLMLNDGLRPRRPMCWRLVLPPRPLQKSPFADIRDPGPALDVDNTVFIAATKIG